MKTSKFVIPAMAGAFLLAGMSSLTAGLTGAIFTTVSNGSVVNGNQYDSPCSVYLDGGPGIHAPAKAAGLPDGDYYFQVTDPSGKTLLSTDVVTNRSFHVKGGVITAYTGNGGPIHLTGIDQDHPELGAITIRLANLNCGTQTPDFQPTPNNGGAYKVWVTPQASLIPDGACSTGCFHGFLPSASKTDNFKVNANATTFCLTVNKVDGSQIPQPIVGWPFFLTDPLGTVNSYFTDSNGQLLVCGLVPGAYTVFEAPDSAIISLTVNGFPQTPATTIYSFTWSAGQQPVIVFQNGQAQPALN